MRFADGNYVVEAVTKVEHIGGETDLLKVQFKDRDGDVYMFGVYTEVMSFLNQEVIASFRDEMIQGQIRPCINNLTVLSKVNVLSREEDIKLYIDDLPDIGSTVNFQDIAIGDTILNAIVYCSYQEFDTSPKAQWVEMTILDKRRNSAKLKLFDPENKDVQIAGQYIKTDLRLTKYGFNTTDIVPVPEVQIPPNPEIDLAKKFILQATRHDEMLSEALQKSNLLTHLGKYMDRNEPEVGYMAVRVAMEIAHAREMKNVSPIVDTELLIRAILLSRLYTLTNSENNTLSLHMQNVMNLSIQAPRLMTKKMLNMLESSPREDLLEWNLLQSIRKTVDILIKARKFNAHVLSSDKKWRTK